jgi:hypothetical protein
MAPSAAAGTRTGLESGSAGGSLPLLRGHAHEILDDLLSVVPALFKHFDRSASVDEAVQQELAARFLSSSEDPDEFEHALLDGSLHFEDTVPPPPPHPPPGYPPPPT